ncbi:NAD(P)-dependent alcohol dehydrogenase [Actinotalea fermentans]|nr:NAD(P)-dependent alcohol dehydrogenase [Actinotalea fermentans]
MAAPTPERAAVSTRPQVMAAVVQDRYGPPAQVLRVAQVAVPTPGPDEVLVRVRAVGLNPADLFLVTGRPAMLRAMTGLRRPRRGGRGQDVAGVVEAVGSAVTSVRPGDEVFGQGGMQGASGTLAELAVVPESGLAPKPAALTFAEAAGLPMAGLAARQGLRVAGVGTGTRLLVNGASGGVGHLAVQLAVGLGAEVTGVCSGRNAEMVRGLGAVRVIDHEAEDFTADGEYDVILDNVLNRRLRDVRRVLAPRGVLLLNSGNGGRVLGPLPRMAQGSLASLVSRQTIRAFTSGPATRELVHLADLANAGEIRVVVEGTYPLADAARALERVATGHVAGKVVVTVP